MIKPLSQTSLIVLAALFLAGAGAQASPSGTHRRGMVVVPRVAILGHAGFLPGRAPIPIGTHRARVVVMRPFFFPPFWYGWYSPYPYYPYAYETPITGTLKIEVEPENNTKAQVYINGALATEFKHKHSLRLHPGEYQIEVRKPGYQSQNRAVYVSPGETLRLDFDLTPAA